MKHNVTGHARRVRRLVAPFGGRLSSRIQSSPVLDRDPKGYGGLLEIRMLHTFAERERRRGGRW